MYFITSLLHSQYSYCASLKQSHSERLSLRQLCFLFAWEFNFIANLLGNGKRYKKFDRDMNCSTQWVLHKNVSFAVVQLAILVLTVLEIKSVRFFRKTLLKSFSKYDIIMIRLTTRLDLFDVVNQV
jgi:hypothetical protein